MKFLDAPQTKAVVRELLRTSLKADLVVAFWGNGAIEELGLGERAAPTTVVCNLESGATNPKVVSQLQSLAKERHGALSIWQHDRLHSKIYLFDDTVIIGSSNASTNGLAFEGGELTHWMEANVLSHDTELIESARRWIAALTMREITSEDLLRATRAWADRRTAIRLPRDTSQTILEAMRLEPSTLADLPISLVIYRDPLSVEARQDEVALQRSKSSAVGLFEDWPELPDVQILLTFRATKTGFIWDEAWQRRGTDEDYLLKSGLTGHVVWKTKTVFGKTPFRQIEKPDWQKLCRDVIAETDFGQSGHICVPLAKIVTLITRQTSDKAFVNDVWESIKILEQHLKIKRGRTVTLGRTRLKIKRVGEVQTVTDLILKSKPSDGFVMLIELGLPDRTFEALTAKYPHLFDAYVRERAHERLHSAS